MLCPSCGQENPPEARFCMSCAQAFARACSSCGAEAPSQARFCVSCAEPLDQAEAAPPARTPTPQPSRALPATFAGGRYLVKSFLGEGGRKKVYLAHDDRLDRDAAIAVIKTEGLDAEGLVRVRREAQAMGRLGDHPHIVTVFDIGDEDGQPYIVSQYMAGGDVEGLLHQAENHRLPLDSALRIADQVCQALQHAHARGIIHRDLKSGNVWLTEDGTAKLGDFGLAVALDRSRLTMAGMMIGTVAYMPPEQALGRQSDARGDLYSLGCMLYEMVTGRPPFLGDDAVAVISQHINTAPVAPSWHNPEVPRALEALILHLLAKAPEERPENAAVVRQALSAISTSPSTERAAPEEANPLDRLAGGVFVGREKEMDELRAGLEDALSGRGRLLMLVGEPGIGKTRTSEELTTYARLRNVLVLWGRCYEGEGAPAYWPWVQLVRSYVYDRDPKELASEMGPGAGDIAQVVSEVRDRLPGLPAPPTLEPEQARFRLFDSITTFLKNAAKAQPIVLVLDDLHWADKPSLLLLQFLARELRGGRLMVLSTYRDVEVRRQHPLAQTLGELNREGLSQRILLRGLTEHDVTRFIELTSGVTPPEALVEAVYRETEGNPFFVNEIVRLLVTDGRLERPEEVTSWSVTIPQSVREVVGRRLDHLSQDCNGVLTTASVIGREFGLDALERVSDLSSDRLLGALEEAVAARVITEVPHAAHRYSFSHALIRETLYEELNTTRRVRLHRQIGEVLEGLHAANPEPYLAELAYHFCEGAQGGDVEKAVSYARRAGERATALLAYEEAAGFYEMALQALELKEPADEERRCDLLLGLGDALMKAGDAAKALETARRAADIARKLAVPELLGAAALCFEDARFAAGGLVTFDEAFQFGVRLMEDALTSLAQEDSALRASLLGHQAMALWTDFEKRGPLSEQAVEMARRLGDPVTLAQALMARHFAVWGPENVENRLEAAAEIIHLAEEAGDKEMALNGHSFRFTDLLEVGDIPAADQELETFARLAEELRQPAYLYFTALRRATRAQMDGRFGEAEKLAQQALAIGQRVQTTNAVANFGAQMFALYWDQGRLQELEVSVKGFVQQYPAIPAWRCALALVYREMGRETEARAEFEALAANEFAGLPPDFLWLLSVAIVADTCAFLGDATRAATLYELLLPYAGRNIVAVPGLTCAGSASRYLGLLAATMSRWEEAARHFEDAIEMNVRMGAEAFAARCQQEYAAMLLARAQPGDREKALPLLTQALETAQRLGMKALVERALALKLEIQGVLSSDVRTSIDAVAAAVYVDKPDLRPHAAPDGTVTLLFSDIEGSTEMTERLGDQKWMEVLREHNKIVRRNVKAHGGFEVKSEGDGFMLAFQSARKALQCAVDIQRAFAQRNEEAEETLRIRIGLHTGEAIKEGADFFGKHVNLTARIAGQAKGGEVLVSSLLKELTEAAGEFSFSDGQEVELKGLKGAHRLFAVAW